MEEFVTNNYKRSSIVGKIFGERKIRSFLGTLLVFSMAICLMHIWVYAVTFDKTIVNNTTFYPSGCLKSLNITVKASGNYATAYGKIAIHSGTTQYNFNRRYTSNGAGWPESINDSSLIAISNNEFLWTDCKEHTVTVVFPDNKIPCDQAGTYYVYLWTRAQSYGVYPDWKFNDTLTVSADGKIKFGSAEVPTSPHNTSEGKTSGQSATCTESGLKDYYLCDHCFKYYEDEFCTEEITDLDTWKTIPALGHNKGEHHNAEAATCSSTGSVEYWDCSRCTAKINDSKQEISNVTTEINASNHNWVYTANDATIEATCSRDSSHTAVLTLAANKPTYSGSIEGTEAFNSTTGLTVAADSNYVKFYRTTTPGATTGGTEIAETSSPKAGYYYAELTVGGQTAVKAFTVKKPNVSNNDGSNQSQNEDNEPITETAKTDDGADKPVESTTDNETPNIGAKSPVNKKTTVKKTDESIKTKDDETAEQDHVHNYDKELVTEEYLKSPATYTEKAVYYKSCECGEVSQTETFISGEVITCKVDDALVDWPKESIESIRCDRPDYQNLIRVYVDEQEVNDKNYNVTEGLTVVNFLEEYLKTLTVGEHIVELEYSDGAIYKGKLTIIDDNSSNLTNDSLNTIDLEKNNDTDNVLLWPILLFVVLLIIAIILLIIYKRRKDNREKIS